MKLVETKCPNCKASIKVDEKNKKATCNYCGAEFLLDDNTIKIKHIMNGEITEEQEFINAETNLNKLKDYDSSYKGYLSLSKRYVDNPEVWIGLLRSLTRDFTYKYGTKSFQDEYRKYWKNYIALASEEDRKKYENKYKEYVDKVLASDNTTEVVEKEQNLVLATVFGGWFGLHKFLKKEITMGLVYLFTWGIFGIGWIIDIYHELKKWPDSKQTKAIKYILIFIVMVIGLSQLEYSVLPLIFCLIASFTITDIIWDMFNIHNTFIRIIVPLIFIIFAFMTGSESVPETLYGTWTPNDLSSNIKEIDLSSTGKVTVNDKILPISSSSKFKDYIYLTVGEEVYTNYKFKYDEKENTLCLLDDKDKCTYYFNLKESTE